MNLLNSKKARIFWISLSYFLVSIIYIHPAEFALFDHSNESMLSNGVDPVAFPYLFNFLKAAFLERPLDFLFATINNPYLDAPTGLLIWDPFIVRTQGLLLSFFLPDFQVSTGLVVLGMFFNSLSMYALSRKLNIPAQVSWGLGLAWGVSAFTRSMGKVFTGLVGVYHLPLLFLGLLILLRNERLGLLKATICFTLIAFMPHYYIVTLTFSLPILIFFFLACRKKYSLTKRFFLRLGLASIPGIVWLSFSLLMPHHPELKRSGSSFPKTGEVKEGKYHPFLDMFAAQPLDYLAGDIAAGSDDLIPLRSRISKDIIDQDYNGNHTHDRAVGIRWILFLITFFALWGMFPSSRSFWDDHDRELVRFFFVFALLSFWYALPPDWPFPSWGGSFWIYKIVPQVRTPSRSGIGVAFSFLLISGLFLKNFFARNFRPCFKKYVGLLFSFIIFLELPPYYQDMPIQVVSPPHPELTNGQECGLGLRYPYVSLHTDVTRYLYLLQKMRGSKCRILNQSSRNELDQKLNLAFGKRADAKNSFVKFARCLNLSWTVLGAPLNISERQMICNELGWILLNDEVCISSDLGASPEPSVDECLMEVTL